jgi:transcriptional regulator with XRE-family HTH domain
MIIETFSKVLRELRVKNKLSQEKLAELCDLDRTYISLLERGHRQPTLTTIFQLSKALHIAPSDFIKMMELQIKE